MKPINVARAEAGVPEYPSERQDTIDKIMSGVAIMRRDERLLPAVFVKELLRDFGFGQMIQRAGVEYMLRKMDEFDYLKEK